MVSRLPESRLLALRAHAAESAERAFAKPSTRLELFSSSSFQSTRNRLVSLQIGEKVPLKTKAIENWPERTDAVCLHCAEACPSIPLPAVKYYDSHEDKFWVYGYFCRPCCSLAYAQELIGTDTHRCLIWTQNVLRVYFGVTKGMKAAPPRSCLKKFGGALSLSEFYGDDDSVFKIMHTPPFVTYAMYAELTNMPGTTTENKDVYHLRRPLDVTSRPRSEPESTEKPPLILEYLARRGAIKPPTTASTSKIRSEAGSVPLTSDEPVKKRKIAASSIKQPEEPSVGPSGGLARYLMK
jgi:hypothetical protein